jgi:hypothetical protein
MKSLYTETRANKSLARFSLDERTALRSILRFDALVNAAKLEASKPAPEAGGVERGELYLKLNATGRRPTKAGLYFVIDTVSETRNVLKVEYTDGGWRVRLAGDCNVRALEGYNKPHYVWFAIPDLGSEDCKLATETAR